MRVLLGILIGIIGIVVGIWIDLWLFFVGGIKEIIAGFSATPADGGAIAWGLVKVFVFTGTGALVTLFLIVAGFALATGKKLRVWRRRNRRLQQPIPFPTFGGFEPFGSTSQYPSYHSPMGTLPHIGPHPFGEILQDPESWPHASNFPSGGFPPPGYGPYKRP